MRALSPSPLGRTRTTAPPDKEMASPVRDLFESDCRYFECGAEVESLGGAWLARMPGLENVAAGCVVQRIDPGGIPGDADAWVEGIEHRLRAAGGADPRFYLQQDVPAPAQALARRGYRRRDEIAMLAPAAPASALPSASGSARAVSLRRAATEADWQLKLALHAACPVGPDGHRTAAERWVELERRKAETGAFEPYLIVLGSAVCGAVAVMECGRVLRLKNIVTDPSRRRRGIAVQAVRRVLAMAGERGMPAVGCFAIAGEAGERLYRRCGFRRAGRQSEWARGAAP